MDFLSKKRAKAKTLQLFSTFKIPSNSPPLVQEEGDVTPKVECMVSNYSPRLSCSRREHWSGSITPPRPPVPPSYPLLCRLTIHQVLSGDTPPPPFSVSDPLCQPLIPCAISHHGLSPRWTGLALSQREKKGQWSQDEPHRDQQNLQEAHGSAGPFSPLSSKIPPSCNSHPLIMCRLQTR